MFRIIIIYGVLVSDAGNRMIILNWHNFLMRINSFWAFSYSILQDIGFCKGEGDFPSQIKKLAQVFLSPIKSQTKKLTKRNFLSVSMDHKLMASTDYLIMAIHPHFASPSCVSVQ